MNKWRLVRNIIWFVLFGFSAVFHWVATKIPQISIPESYIEHIVWSFVNAGFFGMLLFKAPKKVVTFALAVLTAMQVSIHAWLLWVALRWDDFDLQSFMVLVGLGVIWFFHLTTKEEP